MTATIPNPQIASGVCLEAENRISYPERYFFILPALTVNQGPGCTLDQWQVSNAVSFDLWLIEMYGPLQLEWEIPIERVGHDLLYISLPDLWLEDGTQSFLFACLNCIEWISRFSRMYQFLLASSSETCAIL